MSLSGSVPIHSVPFCDRCVAVSEWFHAWLGTTRCFRFPFESAVVPYGELAIEGTTSKRHEDGGERRKRRPTVASLQNRSGCTPPSPPARDSFPPLVCSPEVSLPSPIYPPWHFLRSRAFLPSEFLFNFSPDACYCCAGNCPSDDANLMQHSCQSGGLAVSATATATANGDGFPPCSPLSANVPTRPLGNQTSKPKSEELSCPSTSGRLPRCIHSRLR
jgi:hypothetical protein